MIFVTASSTMSASSTNYREDLFRHQDLTRIHGEPSFATLRILARELRANAGAVHSTLGGGALGHIGLLLTNAQYELLAPGTPYLRPAFPVPGTTHHSCGINAYC